MHNKACKLYENPGKLIKIRMKSTKICCTSTQIYSNLIKNRQKTMGNHGRSAKIDKFTENRVKSTKICGKPNICGTSTNVNRNSMKICEKTRICIKSQQQITDNYDKSWTQRKFMKIRNFEIHRNQQKCITIHRNNEHKWKWIRNHRKSMADRRKSIKNTGKSKKKSENHGNQRNWIHIHRKSTETNGN